MSPQKCSYGFKLMSVNVVRKRDFPRGPPRDRMGPGRRKGGGRQRETKFASFYSHVTNSVYSLFYTILIYKKPDLTFITKANTLDEQ